MNESRVGAPGALGKVLWHAEYLPVPAHAASFAALDAWLTQGMEWAARGAGTDWPAAFAAGAMQGFLFHAEEDSAERALCGALAPSSDAAGRQFPLVVGAPLELSPGLIRRPELLPFVLEGLWAQATETLADALSVPDALMSLARPSGPAASEEEAASLYDRWTAELPLSELWASLGSSVVEPSATLRLVFEAIAPLRGVEPAVTQLCLRLPLGLGGGATLCFWLDLVRRFLGWRQTVPSFFWSHDGSSGTALLVLGRPPQSLLAELWLPSGRRDELVDVTPVVSADVVQDFAPLPWAVAQALSDPQSTLSRLLSASEGAASRS